MVWCDCENLKCLSGMFGSFSDLFIYFLTEPEQLGEIYGVGRFQQDEKILFL